MTQWQARTSFPQSFWPTLTAKNLCPFRGLKDLPLELQSPSLFLSDKIDNFRAEEN